MGPTFSVQHLVILTPVSAAALNSTYSKSKKSGDDVESEAADSSAWKLFNLQQKVLGRFGVLQVVVPVDSCC